ncbi:MAG: hypothetical protein R6X34_30425 [Chloroflexota bacterium]
MSIDHTFKTYGCFMLPVSKMSSQSVSSAALLDANKRLLQLRASQQADCPASKRDLLLSHADERPWDRAGGQADSCQHEVSRSLFEPAALLPSHLGWGSAPLSAALRRAQARPDAPAALEAVSLHYNESNLLPELGKRPFSPSNPEDAVKVYPDIALGILRQEQTAAGRLWLLLRHLDEEGCGFFRVANIKTILTTPKTPMRLCGWRQLRNLLRQGEGIFWQRDEERIWLRSAAKVAYALGVNRLSGQPIAFPVKVMLAGIGTFRAHLYAAFHSGRMKHTSAGYQAKPIARDTLADISGVGRSSQRTYETKAGLQVQTNIAVGQYASQENYEKHAWSQGQAVFKLTDYQGQQGKKGKTYLAWQLPNSYKGQFQHRPKGRQRRINRELNDLVMKGMPGNVEGVAASQKLEKRYYPNGKLAAKTHGRNPQCELYWQRYGAGNGRFSLWQQWIR